MLNDRIAIVLVGTSHSGNLGAVARAMATMALTRLILVSPQCSIDEQAIARASGAEDILTNAVIVDRLETALGPYEMIYGCSARHRAEGQAPLSPKALAKVCYDRPQQTAILFGNERNGLDNHALALCHGHVMIPTNPHFSSLNLASAVQLIAYECYCQAMALQPRPHPSVDQNQSIAPFERIDPLFQRLKTFLSTQHGKRIDPTLTCDRLHRLLTRARPSIEEIDLLHGLLNTAIRPHTKPPHDTGS